MSKIKIKVNVNNEKDHFYTAIFQNKSNILTYKEENNTLVKFNYNQDVLIRENKEFFMQYKFLKKEKTIGEIFIKDLNKTINLDIKTTKLLKNDLNLNIEYEIYDDQMSYKIEVRKWVL